MSNLSNCGAIVAELELVGVEFVGVELEQSLELRLSNLGNRGHMWVELVVAELT